MSEVSKPIYSDWSWDVPEPYKSIYWPKAALPKGVTVFYQKTFGLWGLLFIVFFLAIALMIAYILVPAPFQEYAKLPNDTNDVSIGSILFLSVLAILSASAVVLLMARLRIEFIEMRDKGKIHYGIYNYDDCLVIRLSMWNALVLPYDRITNVVVERVQSVEMKYPTDKLVISYNDNNEKNEKKYYTIQQEGQVAELINKRIKTGIAEAGIPFDKM